MASLAASAAEGLGVGLEPVVTMACSTTGMVSTGGILCQVCKQAIVVKQLYRKAVLRTDVLYSNYTK